MSGPKLMHVTTDPLVLLVHEELFRALGKVAYFSPKVSTPLAPPETISSVDVISKDDSFIALIKRFILIIVLDPAIIIFIFVS